MTGGHIWRLAAPVALLAVVAAVQLVAPAPASAAPAEWATTSPSDAPPPQQARALGRIFGIVPAARGGQRPTASGLAGTPFASGGNLTYHGGPVMHVNKTFAIYWVPRGYTVSASYTSLINRFFGDVAAASGATSNVYASDTQYYDTATGSILYSSSFGGSYLDTAALPASGCVDSDTSVCLTDGQLQQEIARVVSAKGWPTGSSDVYFLFTAKGIGSCISGSSCAFTSYCAYHSSIGSGSGEILYANMPYSDTVPTDCDAGPHPNGDDADATLNVTSHEHNEAITDPLGTAWYDSAGNENGDKCAWNFGSSLGSTANGQYNQLINGNPYYLQLEWSNASSGCVGSYGAASPPVVQGLPVVSGTAQAGSALSASTASWSGTQPMSFAYQWQRCSSSGCVGVGSNASSYALSAADVGSTIQVMVTASNSAGSASATSQPTGVVVAQPSSGTVTVTLASSADGGEVDVNGSQSAGYPPATSPVVYVGQTMTAGRRLAWGSYGIYEPLLRFDTAGVVPAGATITGATLKLYVNRWTSADGLDLVADWLPGAAWPLAGSDWALTGSGNALAPVALGSLRSGAVNSFALTGLAGISSSGYTSLRLELDGGQPAGDNYVQFAGYPDSSAPKPQLVIAYTIP